MDLFFFALESPLFPGALLALFFALAARALTAEPEVSFSDLPRSYRTSLPQSSQAEEVASEVSPRLPKAVSEAVSTASYTSPRSGNEEGSAICPEPYSEPSASDEPIRWL